MADKDIVQKVSSDTSASTAANASLLSRSDSLVLGSESSQSKPVTNSEKCDVEPALHLPLTSETQGSSDVTNSDKNFTKKPDLLPKSSERKSELHELAVVSSESKEDNNDPDFVFVRAAPAEAPLSKEAKARTKLERSIEKNKAKQRGVLMTSAVTLPKHLSSDNDSIDVLIDELSQVYHNVEPDLLAALLDSTNGKFTRELKTELDALSPAPRGLVVEVDVQGAICPLHVLAGTPLFFVAAEGILFESISVCKSDWSLAAVRCVYLPVVFGAYEIKISFHCTRTKTGREPVGMVVLANLLVDTEVYQLAGALDDLYDTLYWRFNKLWTAKLEGAICDLMISVDEDLKQVMQQFGQQMQMFAMGNSMTNLMDMVQEDLTKCLSEQDFAALGRLHQTLHSFLELTKMYPFPPALISTIRHFESVKAEAQKSLVHALTFLSQAVDQHVGRITASQDNYMAHLAYIKVCCIKVLDSFSTGVDLSPLWGLKANQTLYHMMSSLSGRQPDSSRIVFWPVLPLNKVIDRQAASEVDLYTEVLTGEVLMVGSILNFKLEGDLEKNIQVLTGLLHAGLGYVTSAEGTLVALHGTRRAALHLTTTLVHRKLASRYRDVSRVLRNGKKPGTLFAHKLSLRINTDFEQALAKLRLHHKQSWVNDSLEATWRVMYQRLQLIVVELWYGDTMIAADFAHPGRAGVIYVATRFFDKTFRHLQPGFMLALVELKILRDIYGFTLWDLGNTDSNPMMSYKEDLTDVMTRPRFMKIFRKLCETNSEFISRLRAGTLIPHIQEFHLCQATTA